MTVSTCARCRDEAACIASYRTPSGRVVEYLDDRCVDKVPANATITRIVNRLIPPGANRKAAA